MMLAAVETVAQADPIRTSRRFDSDVAAQAATGKSVHAAPPFIYAVGRLITIAAPTGRHELAL
jgi:hypothetical protein